MSKKEKPIKLSQGRYSFRGYTLKAYGSYDNDKGVEWKAVNDETGNVDFTASNLHDLTNIIANQK